MPKQSAGLIVYRCRDSVVEVFLVHPGGPFWRNKDEGAWSIPKGEFGDGEDPIQAAKREFHEETGGTVEGEFLRLAPIKQRSGKVVHAWLVEGDIDPASVNSNTFSLEWPPKSGKTETFPEVDRADWFTFDAARAKVLESQIPLLDEAESILMKLI